MLRSQLDILSEPETNPFECDESTTPDIEEAYPAMQLLDSDHEGDSDIDILLKYHKKLQKFPLNLNLLYATGPRLRQIAIFVIVKVGKGPASELV